MKIKAKIFSGVVFAALTLASQAGATEVITTSLSTWNSTISGSATEWDFNLPNNSYNTASGYSLNVGSFGPVTVTGPDGGGYVLTKTQGYGPSGNLIALADASDGIGSMKFASPAAGLTAFGLGLGLTGTAAPITVTLSDGETFTASPAVNGNLFLGLSSATPITSFALSTTAGTQVQLTDFFAGTSNQPATPDAPAAEVATAVMIGSGLLFFGGCRKIFSNVSAVKA